MSATEFDLWQAFNLIEPIGIMREDSLFASVALTTARMGGVKDLSLSDLMLYRNVPDLTEDEARIAEVATADEVQQMRMNLYSMFGKI